MTRRIALAVLLLPLLVLVPLSLSLMLAAGLPVWAWLAAGFFWVLLLVRLIAGRRNGPLEGGSGPLEGAAPGPRWLDLPGRRGY